MNNEDDIRQRVAAERRARGLSIRAAANLGDVSNTAWNDWESGKRVLSNAVQHGVAAAFDWPVNWPTNPPPLESPREDELKTLLALVLERLAELEAKVDRLER